jgi:hypothetical protein
VVNVHLPCLFVVLKSSSDSFLHWLEQFDVLVDLFGHTVNQHIFNLCHFFGIVFNAWNHHITGFLLAFLHVSIQPILELGDFLKIRKNGKMGQKSESSGSSLFIQR